MQGSVFGIASLPFNKERPPRKNQRGFCSSRAPALGRTRLLCKFCVLLAETVNTSGSVNKALLSRKERMAGRTNFSVHRFALGGKNFHDIAASADKFSLKYFRMNVFLHGILLYLRTHGFAHTHPGRRTVA